MEDQLRVVDGNKVPEKHLQVYTLTCAAMAIVVTSDCCSLRRASQPHLNRSHHQATWQMEISGLQIELDQLLINAFTHAVN